MKNLLIEPLEARIAPATLTIGNAAIAEGDSGTTNMEFTVTLSGAVGSVVTVHYATGDGTATLLDNDYSDTFGTLTFPANVTTQKISVPILGDLTAEDAETFTVTLDSPVGATLGATPVGTGTITSAKFSIADATVAEGASGTTAATFAVTLTEALTFPPAVTVHFATANGTAVSSSDYTAKSDDITFTSNGTQNITVDVTGDTTAEFNEAFTVTLSSPVGAVLDDAVATGKILNDDAAASVLVSIDNVTRLENAATPFAFTASLTAPELTDITVHYKTVAGTGAAGADGTDFTEVIDGTFVILAGESTGTFNIDVLGDAVDERTENFTVELVSLDGASAAATINAADKIGTGTIRNDDLTVTLSDPAALVEGDSGVQNVSFTATLSAVSTHDVTFHYTTNDGSATVTNGDYAPQSGDFTIVAGQDSATILVPVFGDTAIETNETFNFVLSNLQDAIFLTDETASATITDNDPSFTISDVTVTEGNGGTVTALFSVTLSAVPTKTIKVDYQTQDGTAKADADFVALALSTLTWNVGDVQTTKTISVTVNGDLSREVNEQFSVKLSNARTVETTPQTILINDDTGVGTIVDTDGKGAPLDAAPTVSVSDVSLLEGDAGTKNAVFTVSLTQPAGKNVVVKYHTIDGTGAAGSDFTGEPDGTVTILEGQSSATISVPITGDTGDEADETFSVLLTEAKLQLPTIESLTITDDTGDGTILNDDLKVSIASPVAIDEGDAGTTNLDFTVSIPQISAHNVTVFYTTAPGTATAVSDFTPQTGSVVIVAGQTSATISIPIIGDTTHEVDEAFTVSLTGATQALVDDAKGASTATGTITNDDDVPVLSIGNATPVEEGDTGTKNMVFTVTLSAASSQDVTVKFTTNDGTAKGLPVGGTADSTHDYNSATGTVTISAGQTTKTFAVAVRGDTRFEGDETFTVTLNTPTNATIGTGTGTGTITPGDDVAPVIRINDVSAAEGTAANGKAAFTVTLTGETDLPVTVSFATADGNLANAALAASDYVFQTGTLTFAPGVKSMPIVIDLTADATAEVDEKFFVNLTSPTGASIGDAQGIGTIQNDENAFKIELAAGQTLPIDEETGADANNTLHLVVTRSSGVGAASVLLSTVEGTAKSSGDRKDFVAKSQTISFLDGETSKPVDITINKDAVYENAETFRVVLSQPFNGVLGALVDTDQTITITDNEAAPTLSLLPVTSFTEGNTAFASMEFTVQLSGVNEKDENVKVDYLTTDGTAISTGTKNDFIAPAAGTNTLTFAPGEVSKTFVIGVRGDLRDESDETFDLVLSNPQNAAISGATSLTATITDDDAAPTLSVNDRTIGENESVSGLVFTVTLSAESQQEVKVDIHTDAAVGTAIAGTDYTAKTATLTFAPGETTKTFTVPVLDDTLDEANETFGVLLENPVNATLPDGEGVGTITDNDAAPALSINDREIVEGDTGTSDMVFTVNLSQASGQVVTVNFATQDGTAKATGALADYLTTVGTLTFAAGETSKTITVPIIGDTVKEPTQGFLVNLTDNLNASLADGQGAGSILNGDDSTLVLTVSDVAVVEGNSGSTSATFHVQLSGAAASAVTFDVATRNGTAVKGSDYTEIVKQTVTIEAGEDGIDVPVVVKGDATFESTESFFLELTDFSAGLDPTGLDASGRLQVRGTIYNDDTQILNGGRKVQWIDVDGDLATLTVTRGSLSLSDLTFAITGNVGGSQLTLLNLSDDGNEFFGTGISIIATPQPGFTGVTDGRVDVGEIRAATVLGSELQFVGIDLGVVIIDGDLGQITAGDSFSTPAISKLDVFSFGARGTATGASSTQSDVLGPIGTVHVTSTLEGHLHVIGQEFGTIGTLKIDGALKGGSADSSGRVTVTGRIGNVLIKDIIGGSGAASGLIYGDANTGGSIGTVKVTGAITGGTGDNSGEILAQRIGNVTVGSLIGGAGMESGTVSSSTSLGTVTTKGDIVGGAGETSGSFIAGTDMGAVKIGGNVTGGTGEQSGAIRAQRIGNVIVGSLIGGTGDDSGAVSSSTSLGTVTTKGDIVGGAGETSANFFAGTDMGAVKIGGNVTGGTGNQSSVILAGGKIASVAIAGTLAGGSGINTGLVRAEGGGIASIAIGRNADGDSVIGGAGGNSGEVFARGKIGSMTLLGSLRGGLGDASGSIRADVIAALTIMGNVTGTAANPAVISASGLSNNLAIGKLTILGNVAFAEILAGYGPEAGVAGNFRGDEVNADAQIGTVQVNGSVQALNVVAGAQTGGDDRFGTSDDVRLSGSGVRDDASVISKIASVILKGAIIGTTGSSFGIVAQHVVSVKLGAAQTPLAGLSKGPGNDTAPNESDEIGAFFKAVEVSLL